MVDNSGSIVISEMYCRWMSYIIPEASTQPAKWTLSFSLFSFSFIYFFLLLFHHVLYHFHLFLALAFLFHFSFDIILLNRETSEPPGDNFRIILSYLLNLHCFLHLFLYFRLHFLYLNLHLPLHLLPPLIFLPFSDLHLSHQHHYFLLLFFIFLVSVFKIFRANLRFLVL